jgi:peptide/nickel transport system permease protein
VLTLLGVSIIVFTAIHLIPGSYENVMVGKESRPEARARLREKYGLDDPLPIQYARWLLAALGGDMGISVCRAQQGIGSEACENADQTPIIAEFARRAPATIQLALMASIFTIVIGIPLGTLAGLAADSRFAKSLSRATSALAMSVPHFVIGIVLVYLFSRYELGFKVGDYVPFFNDPIRNLRAMALPTFTVSLFGVALVARTMRDAVLTVMAEPYITAAIARGESPAQIVRRHVLRNSAIPVVTVIAVNMGYALGGAVIMERLFSISGFGRYVLLAIQNRDYSVVQAGVMVSAVAFVVINLLADLSYAIIDPRTARRGR